MKSLPYFLFPIVAILGWSYFSEGPRPVYKNEVASIFSERITAFVNDAVTEHCDTRHFSFSVTNENFKVQDDRYLFYATLHIEENHDRIGSFRIDELNSGKIVLNKMECPGKNGEWAVISEDKTGRAKASITE
ncbi:MAG: hypothetical protein A2504_03200 [Bdellovibrionales bacterium RIFOXYD12_FULL_39_22]|nr:MAG: hypothetical protein A2385_15610 [Bdellovibrionales bacterium RIFOXYB1_FULL_39_21]OFZ41535.1 MAG: hypothetical protein A2485_02300 [Bdellovibrionales bacterium RIFOXYC12_FULL_39_17]OFZ45848.1 MAG: hypothetical protein A2404_12665 [Bdellovibrionales bacterium RIFOXYC1_FULL_39_130]OFZ74779.1 MAG: hypothetical protein A2560_10095 [Bdellovibrionales bacterium RIFOXYD1_FULL_39_84]OFZ75314.1 MAG: hypothetical protein A2451_13315 [Bdellovibrionales bacterium RIFOXYC2_FULL_39_8]OFZ92640.1 MAG: